MPTAFEHFKVRARPIFDEAIEKLGREFPNVQFTRGEEEKQICLSAMITDAPLDVPDVVELVISIYAYQKVEPVVDADVVWGDGCGAVEGKFSDEEVPVSEASLEKLYQELPRLISILKTAVQRKKPHNW